MDPHDDQPGPLESARAESDGGESERGALAVADVEPIDADGVRTVAVGSAVWVVVLIALLPFTGPLDDTGRTWWLFTALAGAGLGMVGLEYCRRRSAALSAQSAASDEPGSDAAPRQQ